MISKAILPPARLGVLGGGQLGMYFCLAAQDMGYQVLVLDPDPQAPAKRFADIVLDKDYLDPSVLSELRLCAAITVEFENVAVELMQQLAPFVHLSPKSEHVLISQHRLKEKQAIAAAGLQHVPYYVIEEEQDFARVDKDFFPAILKIVTLGYDGKGQKKVLSQQDLKNAWSLLGQVPSILEKKINLAAEASVIVCRLHAEAVSTFPIIDNLHDNGILFCSSLPSRLPGTMQAQLHKQAIELANYLDYVGVLVVEFFLEQDNGAIYVNEIAPRPHNSGHYSLDASLTSQFQQQVRLLCGLPPAATDLLSPCAMINLLGDLWKENELPPDWQILLEHQAVQLHLYGKSHARIGRKMGHFTLLGQSAPEALIQAQALYQILKDR